LPRVAGHRQGQCHQVTVALQPGDRFIAGVESEVHVGIDQAREQGGIGKGQFNRFWGIAVQPLTIADRRDATVGDDDGAPVDHLARWADQPWRAAADQNQVVALRERQGQERDVARQLAERGIQRISARYGEMGPNMLRDILEIMDELAARERSAGEGPGADLPRDAE